MLRALLIANLCCIHFFVLGQPKTLQAVKTLQPPQIDGNLNDAAWLNAPAVSDFVQYAPSYGSPTSSRTQVKILYDNEAVYIGAYLYDDPSLIRKQITSRDGEQQQDVDFFSVFLDTYNDQQNGFQFLVTSANVQTDAKLTGIISPNFLQFGDRTWDAVWESRVQMHADGWTVEMKIPYLSLRFSKKDIQTWGLQFLRYSRRNNEQDYWNPLNPNVNGFVNQFGKYVDLKNIKPPLRLSFYPYLSGGLRVNADGTPGVKNQWLRSGGMDVKYGINESFTLDATLVPYFGQVVSDDVVNNLTPYEQKFNENRPFFTEGTELFNKAGLFYSRRIGAVPPGYYSVENMALTDPTIKIIDNPSVTKLYNAIKFSGRTKDKLGIGVFNAITEPMYAIIQDQTGNRKKILTSPLINYNIIVLDQALKKRSFITFTNLNTIRNGSNRDANVSSLDLSLYDKTNTFNLRTYGRYSKVFSSNSYDGYNAGLKLGKVSGRIQYYARTDIFSTNYDPRDLGYLQTADLVNYIGQFSYNQFTPTKNFLNYSYSVNTIYQRIYQPNQFYFGHFWINGSWTFKNFWDVQLNVGALPTQRDYFVLGKPAQGLFVKRPAYGYVELSGGTDSRKKLYFSYDWLQGSFFHANPQKSYHLYTLGLRYRFNNKTSVSIDHHEEAEQNYIINTYVKEPNGDPIIGFVNFKDIYTTLSGIHNFTPKLNLNFRLRHDWSSVPYNSFANVDSKGNAIPRPFLTGLDENVNFFNVDAFLSWDFKLGCNLTVGYKNWIGDTYSVDGLKYPAYLHNFSRVFNVPHGNELTVKFIYFLDYNQLRKKK